MNKYLGVKLIQAELMDYEKIMEILSRPIEQRERGKKGYFVRYEDGYRSYSPKEVFEEAYIKVGNNNTIEEHNINEFIKSYDVSQWGDKTTVVHATLVNGFIITESSSCVDVANFNMDIGASICKERINNKLWEMLGFMLQAGVKGIK